MRDRKQISQGSFLKRIKDTIKHYDMLHKGDKVLVAVSGGADSVCLLRALKEFIRPLGIELIVANMDHCIRGRESEKDSEFVKGLSEKLGIKYVHKKVELQSIPRKNMSLEEKARMERYAFFVEAAKDNGCSVIATGHTMNDQAETVMMRIIKGALPRSVAGIPAVRFEKDIKVIRPLIRSEREYILGFLNKEKADFVEDKTNQDPKYFRNKVRLQVIPYLEKINPQIKRTLVNFAEALTDDLEVSSAHKVEVPVRKVPPKKAPEKREPEKKTPKKREPERKAPEKRPQRKNPPVKKIQEKNTSSRQPREIKVKIRDLLLQPSAIRKAVFKELFIKAGGDVKKLTHRHWMDMDYFLRSSNTNNSIDLPGNIMAERSKEEITFKKRVSGKK